MRLSHQLRRFSSAPPPPLATLLAGFHEESGKALAGEITPSWMQGQTTFGGLSAALCVLGARRLIADAEPALPLRSAQVCFLGAAGGAVSIGGQVLRRGRSSAFVRADVTSSGGVATSSTFAFCKTRSSMVDRSFVTPPDPATLPPPEECTSLRECLGASPAFMENNFELRIARRGSADHGGSNLCGGPVGEARVST